MKKQIRRAICILLILSLWLSLYPTVTPASAAGTDITNLLVDYYSAGSGNPFTITTGTKLYVIADSAPTGKLLQTLQHVQELFARSQIPSATPLEIVYGPVPDYNANTGNIYIRSSGNNNDGTNRDKEWYELNITSNRIVVDYNPKETNCNGLLYGMQTILKSMLQRGDKSIAACVIRDTPDTKERTVMLDCARKYWTVPWIKNLIQEMSWMGYNTLELHLTEDQGILANIWKDSNGTTIRDVNGNDFSWMIGNNVVSWNTTYGDKNGSYYNREQLTEIVNYAHAHNIEIIPAVDFPTHADTLIAKFKSNFVDQGKSFTFRSYKTDEFTASSHLGTGQYIDGTLDIANNTTKQMAIAITQAYGAFFQELGCTKFNIGCDEVAGAISSWGNGYNGNPKDRFIAFVNELDDTLRVHYKYKVRVFNDALFGNAFYVDGEQWTGTATKAVNDTLEVCVWTNRKTDTSPETLANTQGRTVYNCQCAYTYQAMRQHDTYGDARDAYNTNWGMNHTQPKYIYSGCGGDCVYGSACTHNGAWNPSDFGSPCGRDFGDRGTSSVTGDKLGGGYFLIWADWADWDTEKRFWERTGNTPTGADTSNGTNDYSLINRLWSNAIKQWNWDINNTLGWSDFLSYRETVKFFPAYVICTAVTVTNLSFSYRTIGSSTKSGLYLGMQNGAADSAAQAMMLDTTGKETWWEFKKVGNAYTIRNGTTNRYLQIDSSNNITTSATADNARQQWYVLELDVYTRAASRYLICNASTKTYVTLNGSPAAAEMTVVPTSFAAYHQKGWNQGWNLPTKCVHNFKTTVTSATCTSEGYTTSACSGGCGDVIVSNRVAALGHDITYTNNNDGTHSGSCSRGDLTAINQAHYDKNGACVCGFSGMCIRLLTKVGATDRVISMNVSEGNNGKSFTYTIPSMRGYVFTYVDQGDFVPNVNGADCGTISGTTKITTITVHYKNQPDLSRLKTLLDQEELAGLDAFTAAKSFYDSVKSAPQDITWQEQVDGYVEALVAAAAAMTNGSDATVKNVELLTGYVACGKEALVRVTTGGAVSSLYLTVGGTQTELTRCSAYVNQDGTKTWLIQFAVSDTAGSINCQIYANDAGGDSKSFTITVK